MKSYDIVVVGLGAMGSSALYHSAIRGLTVLGIDQFESVPHTQGSHHGNTRIIRKAYFEDPGYVPLVQKAYELWHKLEQESGRKLLVQTGGVMIGPLESQVVTGSILSARQHGLPYEEWTAADVKRRFPAFHMSPTDKAVYEPDAGYVFPESAIRSHIEQAVANGAELKLGCKVQNWKANETGVVIELDGERVHADKMILTVGAWASEQVPELPLTVERQFLLWFRAPGHLMDDYPIYLFDQPDGVTTIYGFPNLQSEGVKVALHHSGEPCTPESIRREVDHHDIKRVRDVLKERIPVLAEAELLDSSTCMYTNTPDENFVVGPHPEYRSVILGLGYSGHGFKFSSAMGELLVQLAREQKSPVEVPAMFDPSRWAAQTQREV